jgi:hypothetical protein
MRIEQRRWTQDTGWEPASGSGLGDAAQLVFLFGAAAVLQKPRHVGVVRSDYPQALVFGCSTAGEICGTDVTDDSMIATAVAFDHSQIRGAFAMLGAVIDSKRAGEELAQQLPAHVPGADGASEELVHVLALTDGIKVNGSEFVAGLTQRLPAGVSVTGGMAGDGVRFGETRVFHEGIAEAGAVAAVGLYGPRLRVGYGSLGGWDAFGEEMLVTSSKSNVLYELNGMPALTMYKALLGSGCAHALPASGLLFPLCIRTDEDEPPVVRTILSIDAKANSITFAGDVPEGAYARLMQANFERLVDGATGAARICQESLPGSEPELGLLISCVGRRLVLRERVEDEVRAVRQVLGERPALTGFYSYGEISPFTPGARCELHNQTMTITTLSER